MWRNLNIATAMRHKTLLALLLCLYSSVEGQQRICEHGWTEFKDPSGASLCIMTVNTSLPWLQAKAYCEISVSHLINLDRVNQFAPVGKGDPRSIGNSIFNEFRQFWSGLHLDTDRLMWHDYGPRLVFRSRYNTLPWSWGIRQPSDEQGTCGTVTLGSRATEEDPNGVQEQFDGQFTAALNNCNTSLPFVCQKPAVLREVKPLPNCDNGWVGNIILPHCYKIIHAKASYKDAKKQCRANGSILAPASNLFDQQFSLLVYTYFQETDTVFQQNQLDNPGVWADSGSGRADMCRTVNPPIVSPTTEGFFEDPTNTRAKRGLVEQPQVNMVPCDTELFVLCTKRTSYNKGERTTFEVETVYRHQKELLSFPAFDYIPISAVFGRQIGENEVVFISTPTSIINSTDNFQQWDLFSHNDQKFSTRYDITSDPVSTVPRYINVTLPSKRANETPARRRRLADKGIIDQESGSYRRDRRGRVDARPMFVDYDYVRFTTGYYVFGLYHMNPAKFSGTKPVLVRYAEPDLYIYVVTADMKPGQESLSRSDISSFNMLQDETYVSIIREFAGQAMDNAPRHTSPAILYYRSQIEAISQLNVKFRTFVSVENSRRWSADMEQRMLAVVGKHWKDTLNDAYFDTSSMRIWSTVACPSRKLKYFGKNNTEYSVTFSSKKVGKVGFSWERCYQGKGAIASSKCVGGYVDGASWEPPTIKTQCQRPPPLNESSSTVTLKILAETTMDNNNFQAILEDTANLTSSSGSLTNADVIYIAEILHNFRVLDNITQDALEQVYDIARNVLDVESDIVDSAQTITNAANRILRNVDELTSGFNVVGPGRQRFVRSTIASEVLQQLGDTDLTIGVELKETPTAEIDDESFKSISNADDVKLTSTDTAIYLPINLIKGVRSKLSFNIYGKAYSKTTKKTSRKQNGKANLFSVINGKYQLNSKVAAATFYRNDMPVTELVDGDRVTAVFYPLESNLNMICAFWNYSANDAAGDWATEGCTTSMADGRVVCECDHLTNFAVLIDLDAETISETNKLILSIITKIGLAVSIVGLSMTILVFLIFKHLRSGRGQQVLVNLCVSMLFSSIIFLVGMDRTESKVGCMIMAALLHYFILVSFMWMLVEGLLQYLRFVKVLGTYIPNFMKKSMVPAWGIPLIPVIVVLAVDYDLYYGGKGYCWMAREAMLYAFIIPVAVIIFINIVVFSIVVFKLLRRRKTGMTSNQSEKKMALLHFQAAISIFVILGLTWVFGFLAIDGAKVVFHYLFAIFNAFQGFFIFLLFTAREKQIRLAWKKLCCKKAAYTSTSGGRHHTASSGNTHSTESHNLKQRNHHRDDA